MTCRSHGAVCKDRSADQHPDALEANPFPRAPQGFLPCPPGVTGLIPSLFCARKTSRKRSFHSDQPTGKLPCSCPWASAVYGSTIKSTPCPPAAGRAGNSTTALFRMLFGRHD